MYIQWGGMTGISIILDRFLWKGLSNSKPKAYLCRPTYTIFALLPYLLTFYWPKQVSCLRLKINTARKHILLVLVGTLQIMSKVKVYSFITTKE